MAASGPLYTTATTMTLAAIVACQIGNVFACRTERESVLRAGFLSNRLVLWGIAAEIGIILALMYTPFLQRIFGLAPLSAREWSLLLLFPFIIIVMEEGRKWLVRIRS